MKRTFTPLAILQENLSRASRIAAMAERAAAKSQKAANNPDDASLAMAMTEKAMEINAMAIHLTYQYLEMLDECPSGRCDESYTGEDEEDPH